MGLPKSPRPPGQIAAIIARNAVPVIGIYWYGWSSHLIFLDYWFDGLSWLAAIMFMAMPKIRQEFNAEDKDGETGWIATFFLTLFGFFIVGIPFWFVLGAMHAYIEPSSTVTWSSLLSDPSVVPAAVVLLVSNLFAALSAGLPRMPEKARIKYFNWEYALMLTRIIAMLMTLFLLPAKLIIVLIILLTLIDLYPMRAMKIAGAPMDESDRPDRRP
ncbi:MAG: hypothetical protein DHS20C11_31190 [Lysobacteraceae bacterium]|nr:MAG: hypothetical protein DHS20C11_31190 [Xanthomonadaceae bacterium]